MSARSPLLALDVFAGAGGLSRGAELAGLVVSFALERDHKALATYVANHPSVDSLCLDIGEEATPTEIAQKWGIGRGDIDVVMGGPPCQGFSISNLRTRNSKNPETHAYKHLLEFARVLKPHFVVMENVAGILTFENGSTVQHILGQLSALGYRAECLLLNAVDFGVPQRRKRVFLIGSMLRSKTVLECLDAQARLPVSVGEAIHDLPVIQAGNNNDELSYRIPRRRAGQFARQLRQPSMRVVSGCSTSAHTPLTRTRFATVPQGGNWQDIPSRLFANYSKPVNCHRWLFRRLRADLPAITISNFRKGMIIHPEEDRTLSIREAARLQTFPDDYVFHGNLQARQQQVADAVPPFLAAAVLEGVLRSIK